MRQMKDSEDTGGGRRGTYRANLLGTIKSHLEGLQGYEVMALELVQNADDARAQSIIFDVCDDALYVGNNEEFSSCKDILARECEWALRKEEVDKCDFHRITEVASGSKLHHPENIGRFGIGFVSVYQISDHPEIASRGVRLILVPESGDFYEKPAPDMEGSEFRLPWAMDAGAPGRRALSASPVTVTDIDALPNTLTGILGESLLFLRHITHAEVRRNGTLVSSFRVNRDPATGHLEISAHSDDHSSSWYVLYADAAEPAARLCKQFPTLAALKRNTNVTMAIPIGETTGFVGRFFAYLPTEQRHGLSLHINADFFPEPDRKAIVLTGGQHQQAWNAALIECAAATLAANLIALREPLGPVRLWEMIDEACAIFKQEKQNGAYQELTTFWNAIKTSLAQDPPIAFDAGGNWLPASNLLHTRTTFDSEEVGALRRGGVNLNHSSLAGFSEALIEAGASPLNPRSLGDALTDAHMLEELRSGGRVTSRQRQSLLEHLWRALDKVLTPDGSLSRECFAMVPLFLSHDQRLLTFEEGRTRPEKVSLDRLVKWFSKLPLPHKSLETLPNVLQLAEELGPGRVFTELEVLCQSEGLPTISRTEPTELRGFYRLIRDLMVGVSREADSRTLSELAQLPIFRAGNGFVSANGCLLPGDFEDPIGVASLLDKECYDPVTQEFLREHLGVKEQSIEAYVTSQMPTFFSDSPPIDKYKALLTVLAKHPDLLSSSEAVDTLINLRIVPTRNGGWNIPGRVYMHSKQLETLLGFGAEWWLDESRIPKTRGVTEFLVDLGIRETPSAEHLLEMMEKLTESEPSEEVQKRSERLFYAICDNFENWNEDDGVDLEWLVEFQSKMIFPADGIYDEWFSGDELYAPYRSGAFSSQANFLPFRTTQRLNRDVLNFFEVNFEPTTEMVIAHLRHCVAEGVPVSPLAYQILNERARDQTEHSPIAELRDEPCARFLHEGRDPLPFVGKLAFRVEFLRRVTRSDGTDGRL